MIDIKVDFKQDYYNYIFHEVELLREAGFSFPKIRNDNKQALENRYNQAFYEMSSYIENIDTLLAKTLVSKDPSHGAKTMSEVWRQANLAKTNLSELPIEQNLIAQTSKFLSRTIIRFLSKS
mgnify:CR=1 FL=1